MQGRERRREWRRGRRHAEREAGEGRMRSTNAASWSQLSWAGWRRGQRRDEDEACARQVTGSRDPSPSFTGVPSPGFWATRSSSFGGRTGSFAMARGDCRCLARPPPRHCFWPRSPSFGALSSRCCAGPPPRSVAGDHIPARVPSSPRRGKPPFWRRFPSKGPSSCLSEEADFGAPSETRGRGVGRGSEG